MNDECSNDCETVPPDLRIIRLLTNKDRWTSTGTITLTSDEVGMILDYVMDL